MAIPPPRLRAVQVGGSIRYRLADLLAWIDHHTENPDGTSRGGKLIFHRQWPYICALTKRDRRLVEGWWGSSTSPPFPARTAGAGAAVAQMRSELEGVVEE